jgi:hypothetical protein
MRLEKGKILFEGACFLLSIRSWCCVHILKKMSINGSLVIFLLAFGMWSKCLWSSSPSEISR